MISKKSGEERREKIRVDFATKVTITTQKSKITVNGSSNDLSLSGIFVKTNEDIPEGTQCEVEVWLTGMEEEIALKMQGYVVRKVKGGLAVAFETIDIDSYTHLKNIIRYNTDDPDKVI